MPGNMAILSVPFGVPLMSFGTLHTVTLESSVSGTLFFFAPHFLQNGFDSIVNIG